MEPPFVLLVLLAVAAVAATIVWLVLRRRPRTLEVVAADPPASTLETTEAGSDPPEPAGFVALTTKNANEFYLLGEVSEIESVGATLAHAPAQLGRHAATLRSAVDGARSYGEMSGRLVLVDGKTAAAMRAGAMVRDGSGEMLALAKDADGKFRSVARLRRVGGAAASAAALSNALSAMALQAQLDRIERKLSAIAEGVDDVAREQLIEWHAQTRGAQDILHEVYRTGMHAGDLSPANWGQIASIGQVIRAQIRGDRQRLADLVARLEAAARTADIKAREKSTLMLVQQVSSAHAALVESTRAWVQFSGLRLWHFTVTDEPALEAYRQELEAFMRESHDVVAPLGERATRAVQALDQARWHRRAQRPIVNRRLVSRREHAVEQLSGADWNPLELRPPSREVEIWEERH